MDRIFDLLYIWFQLSVVLTDANGQKIDPGARLDPEGHDVYAGKRAT